ncbi:PREDICTED: relaxin-3 receptor 2-like [Thamnophis sirtalis]|uniref:Relaxin-3 receptor 2-like n=1 Tax=Thamnophis sirtalis TaxID=35019 RepID=A0A6I9XWU0_9SAUR|nr:PREDICTED: relaxin-3 receptor 2-like [Thamnophis sirtalis]
MSRLQDPACNASVTNGTPMGTLDLFNNDVPLVLPEVSFGLRISITTVYLLVCAAGLLGNSLVMYLIWIQKETSAAAINIMVFGLAAADFQFSLMLPFWATEVALDFQWPFGHAMCKAVPSLTLLSIYANVFLLTAMAVSRYCSVVSAVKGGFRMTPRATKCITAGLWAVAVGATVPTAVYAGVIRVAGVELCLFQFPSLYHLGIYQLQRVVFAFVIPLVVILTSYLRLLWFLKSHHVPSRSPTRHKQVASTVRLMVGCFFVCWFPNHVVTLWGVLVKVGALPMDHTFHYLHTYAFPLTTCLAHTNSCLNPILYCLIRREFQEAMKDTFRRLSSITSYQLFSSHKAWEEGALEVLPLRPSDLPHHPQSGAKEGTAFSSILGVEKADSAAAGGVATSGR